MKTRAFSAATVAILLMASLLHAANAPAGPSWTFVGYTKYRDPIYLDTSRLTKASAQESLAICRITPSAKSRFMRQIQGELRKAKILSTDFRYMEISAGIDCEKKAIRFPAVKYFAADGSLLLSNEEPAARWTPIAPGSRWDSLREKICGKEPR